MSDSTPSFSFVSPRSINIGRLFFEILALLVATEAILAITMPLIATDLDGVGDALLDTTILTTLAAPLILWRCVAMMRRAQQTVSLDAAERESPRGVLITSVAALGVGIGLSLAAFHLTKRSIDDKARQRFDHLTERLTNEAARRTNLPGYGLRGARSIFAASERVSREEFHTYVDTRNLATEFPGVFEFGFIERVVRADLMRFVDGVRADGMQDYDVRGDAGHEDELYLIKYIEPMDGSSERLGLDMGADRRNHLAIERAIETGEPTLSAHVMLTRPGHPACPGFYYYMPVYRNGVHPSTTAARYDALVGLVYAPVVVDRALSGLADAADGELDIEVFDGTELTTANLLLDTDGVAVSVSDRSEGTRFDGRTFHDVRQLEIGGRIWSLAFTTTDRFDAEIDRLTPALVGVAGMALSLLIAAILWTLGQGRRRALAAAAFAQDMNSELLKTKAKAERANHELEVQLALGAIERERLDLALTCGRMGAWEWNPDADTADFDQRCSELVGEQWIGNRGSDYRERIHPDDKAATAEQVDRHFRGETKTYESVHRSRHRDGSYRWILSRGVVVSRNAEGKPTRVVGLFADVSERKELEQQLAQSQRLESLGELAAGIAHEINTPTQYVGDNIRFMKNHFASLLTLLDGYAAQMEGAGQPWAQRREEILQLRQQLDVDFLRTEIPLAIDQSLEGIERVTTIVRAMKEFSHPGSDTKEMVELNRAILSTIEVCRNRWKYVADLETDLDPQLPTVPCLVAQFNQVMLNLIVNAADAIAESLPADGSRRGRIRVTSRLLEDEQSVEVRVTDDGPGMPEAVQARIFEPFFTTKPVGKGTGQGLSLSRNVIVHRHGGRLSFESAAGAGTSFIIQLPLVDPATASGAAAENPTAGTDGNTNPVSEAA